MKKPVVKQHLNLLAFFGTESISGFLSYQGCFGMKQLQGPCLSAVLLVMFVANIVYAFKIRMGIFVVA